MGSALKPIVVVGSINMDLVAAVEKIPAVGETVNGSDFQIHPGGKGANQAVAIARLGYPVQMISKVGTDVFGDQLLSYLQKTGVDVNCIDKHPGPSGVATIAVSKQGENSIVVIPGANAHVTPDFLSTHRETIRNAGMVLAQLEIPMETVESLAELCGEEGIPLMLDPAPAQSLKQSVFRRLHWLTPNETEATFYTKHVAGSGHVPEQIAASLLQTGVKNVVLKMGSRGVCIASANEPLQMLPAFSVKAVDTTAAGDAFNGAFATALMLGMAQSEAARFAAAAAAVSVTRHGAQPSMPTRAEIDQLLNAS